MKKVSFILVLCMVCSHVIGEEVRVNGLNYILDQKDNTAIVGSNFDAKGDA